MKTNSASLTFRGYFFLSLIQKHFPFDQEKARGEEQAVRESRSACHPPGPCAYGLSLLLPALQPPSFLTLDLGVAATQPHGLSPSPTSQPSSAAAQSAKTPVLQDGGVASASPRPQPHPQKTRPCIPQVKEPENHTGPRDQDGACTKHPRIGEWLRAPTCRHRLHPVLAGKG